jgi:uncharacterized RDD family membrane protein YckC
MKIGSACWRLLLGLALFLGCLLPSAALAKDLLVDASNQTMWVAATMPGDNGLPPESLIFGRTMGNDQWQQLYEIASPMVALTHQAGEPAIVLDNGQWMFIYSDGRSLGPDVPARGNLVQLSADGDLLYGLAWVNGGLASLHTTTQPTTASTSSSKLVLLQFSHGQWLGLAEIPDAPPKADVSMTGGENTLLIAWQADNELHLCQWAGGAVKALPAIQPKFKIADFKVICTTDQPIAWIAPATGAGAIFKWNQQWGAPISLSAPSTLAQSQQRDICIDGDQQIRLVYKSNDQLYEQNYDVHGKASGAPTEILAYQQDETDNTSRLYGLAFFGFLIFILLSAFRRPPILPPATESGPAIMLAPFLRRLGAGLVDILPYLVTGTVILAPYGSSITTYDQWARVMNQPSVHNPILISLGVYLLHTTLGEIFFARSIGKYLFGLRLINFRGERPSALAVLVRNVCRLIDLPFFFVTILISPLRQRVGDFVSGTLVVITRQVNPEELPQSEQSPP